MSGLTREDLLKLHAPFPAGDIEWRIQQAGKKNDRIWARVLAYVTNRAIQQRLDDVCGPENWYNVFQREKTGDGKMAVLCGIAIRVQEDPSVHGSGFGWVTKWDGAEETDVESVKGGLSASMKRAAVQWGIGRYLYDLTAGYATVSPEGKNYAKVKDVGTFNWDPPALPAWALPGVNKPSSTDTSGTDEVLSGIRAAFPAIPNDYEVNIEGNKVNLRDWLRDGPNGDRLRNEPALARKVLEICRQVE